MDEVKIPEPYPCGKSGHVCPYTIRCEEIDEAAALIKDPDAFALAAANDKQFTEGGLVFFTKPTRKFREAGGCPAYAGHFNGGSSSSILCGLVKPQLHDYIEIKFCEGGRNYYCPIWRAKGKEGKDG